MFWSTLHRRLDGSIESFLERCLQLGAIAKTVYHLLFLIRVIQAEVTNCSFVVFLLVYCVVQFMMSPPPHPCISYFSGNERWSGSVC